MSPFVNDTRGIHGNRLTQKSRSCLLNQYEGISHNALFRHSQTHSVNDSIYSGKSSEKLHCGNVLNMPYYSHCVSFKNKYTHKNRMYRVVVEYYTYLGASAIGLACIGPVEGEGSDSPAAFIAMTLYS